MGPYIHNVVVSDKILFVVNLEQLEAQVSKRADTVAISKTSFW
jgi:hypothetical protein